ncbi:MAG: tetratricopeptide repeat protein [Asgard group archaeon]|nr:tetratricopeptide repeat protein [Asgard group archaeon]
MSEELFIKTVEPLLNKKEYKSALKLAEKEAKKNPENPFAWYAKGVCLLNLKNFDKAIDAFNTFISNKRANLSWGYYYLAESFFGLKEYSKAVEHYKKALEYNPKYYKALIGLETCYRRLNDAENAIKINLILSEKNPRDKHSWYWLSVIHLVKGDYSNAYSYILRAIKAAPKDEEVKKLYEEIKNQFEETNQSQARINALKEISIRELGYGSLSLNDKEIKSLKEIESLEITRLNLSHLNLEHNEIEEISCLDDFPELLTLDLNDNKITNTNGLGNLPKLQTLKLEGNIIQKISGLDNLPSLYSLKLSDNQITKIEGLEKLELFSLDLSDNQLTEITGLDNQKKLTNLYLSGNAITKLTGLSFLPSLKTLNLANNQISTLIDYQGTIHVEYLNLSNNNLSTLEGLEKFPELKSLNLEGNTLLPEYFAKYHDKANIIADLRKYSGKSNEELKKLSIEILEKIKAQEAYKEKIAKEREERLATAESERVEREAYYGSYITSAYGAKVKLKERMNELLKINEDNNCLYCTKSLPKEGNYQQQCESMTNRLIKDLMLSLPAVGKDKDHYTERKVTEYQTNRRMDIYDRPGYTMVTRTIKTYMSKKIGRFYIEHFPKLLGTLCKDCGDEFIKKVSMKFKRLKRRGLKTDLFVEKIQKPMKDCHEDYMKILEQMIAKRGY